MHFTNSIDIISESAQKRATSAKARDPAQGRGRRLHRLLWQVLRRRRQDDHAHGLGPGRRRRQGQDGHRHLAALRVQASMVARWLFGPSGFWTMASLRYAAKFDPFLSLDCAPTPSTLAQSKERKGSNLAIWQPCETTTRAAAAAGTAAAVCSSRSCRRSGTRRTRATREAST